MVWVVCEGLGKFPHEVEQMLTIEELTEYYALLKMRKDDEVKAQKQAEVKARSGGRRRR